MTTNGQTSGANVVEGVVEQLNDHGIKVQGEWRNVSKFGKPVDLPGHGARVRVELDTKGFIKSLVVLEGGAPASTPGARDERQRSIVRQSSLKAAVDFYGMVVHDPQTCGKASADVLRLATLFAAWVNREDDD